MRVTARARRLASEPVTIRASTLPAPVLTYVVASEEWRLEATYVYAAPGATFRLPAGFRFDLASVPRWLWWLIAPFELSITAPLVHDFLYRYAGDPPSGAVSPPTRFTRREADTLFRTTMAEEGVSPARRFVAFWAVRLFGGTAWGRTPGEG